MKTLFFSSALLCTVLPFLCPPVLRASERGLVAYWSFDESGDEKVARDYSGNGRNLQLGGVHRTKGVCGGGLALRGRRFVQCAPPEDGLFLFPGDYTIEVWVRHTSKRPQRYISKWTGKGDQSAWWLGYYEHKAQFGDYYDGGQARPCAVDVADGKWHQVVGVRRGRTAYLYVDARPASKTATPGMIAGYNNAPVVIGAYAGSWPFEGAIDEVRLYCRALTEGEIRSRYEEIRSGRKKPTLAPVAHGLKGAPAVFMIFPGAQLRRFPPWFDTRTPLKIEVIAGVNLPVQTSWQGTMDATITPAAGGNAWERTVRFSIPEGAERRKVSIEWPPLPPGTYVLRASIRGEKTARFERNLTVVDYQNVVAENKRIREQRRRSGDPFTRGIISSYAGLLWDKRGRPDVDGTLKRIRDLGVNGYTYLIHGRSSDRVLDALPEFCTKAAAVGIEVWAYLVPPSEAPIGRDKPIPERKYPPFDMDYLKWAGAVARIAAAHPNLTLWMIDDFDGNTAFFTRDYTRRIYQTSKRIAPNLRFGVCVYYDSIRRFMKAGYGPWFDAVLWGYQHSFQRFPEAGRSAASLPIEINDYYKLCPGKVLIPCIYFTAHSSWPRDRPTREYLAEALRVSFEQTGVCWIFTTPAPGSWKARLLRDFCRTVDLPPLPLAKP